MLRSELKAMGLDAEQLWKTRDQAWKPQPAPQPAATTRNPESAAEEPLRSWDQYMSTGSSRRSKSQGCRRPSATSGPSEGGAGGKGAPVDRGSWRQNEQALGDVWQGSSNNSGTWSSWSVDTVQCKMDAWTKTKKERDFVAADRLRSEL